MVILAVDHRPIAGVVRGRVRLDPSKRTLPRLPPSVHMLPPRLQDRRWCVGARKAVRGHRPPRKTSHAARQVARIGFFSERSMSRLIVSPEAKMSDYQREIYHSENGDRWFLCRNEDGRVFVLHKANVSSGGATTQ